MARVTVEDCIEKVESHFELVMIAARRARELASGSLATLERDGDKDPVVALREIAEDTVSTEDQRDSLVAKMQKFIEPEDAEEAPDFSNEEDSDLVLESIDITQSANTTDVSEEELDAVLDALNVDSAEETASPDKE